MREVRLSLIVVLVALTALAQRRGFRNFGELSDLSGVRPNAAYDGRFTFVRVKYTTAPGGYWYRGLPAWAHGYPVAEQNLMRIMKEVSDLDAHVDEINVLTLDDPELFKYPVAYIIEVGWWTLTDTEAAALRTYIQKGGFVIVDDFKMPGWRGLAGGGWEPFEANMKRVFPAAGFVAMRPSDPVFHSFFEVKDPLGIEPPYARRFRPQWYGIFEDNDPNKRLMVAITYNNDISEYWEWSNDPFMPIEETNEAYKYGVNYVMYALTH